MSVKVTDESKSRRVKMQVKSVGRNKKNECLEKVLLTIFVNFVIMICEITLGRNFI